MTDKYTEYHGMLIKREYLEYRGWGLVGYPLPDVVISDGDIDRIDVTGYNEADYWRADTFLGPDTYGIVPVYEAPHGEIWPPDAVEYAFFA